MQHVATVGERCSSLSAGVETTRVNGVKSTVGDVISFEQIVHPIGKVPAAKKSVMRSVGDRVAPKGVGDAPPEDSWLVGPAPKVKLS